MHVKIEFVSSSVLELENVHDTYESDGLYCIVTKHKEGTVIDKIPIRRIYAIEEFKSKPEPTEIPPGGVLG